MPGGRVPAPARRAHAQRGTRGEPGRAIRPQPRADRGTRRAGRRPRLGRRVDRRRESTLRSTRPHPAGRLRAPLRPGCAPARAGRHPGKRRRGGRRRHARPWRSMPAPNATARSRRNGTEAVGRGEPAAAPRAPATAMRRRPRRRSRETSPTPRPPIDPLPPRPRSSRRRCSPPRSPRPSRIRRPRPTGALAPQVASLPVAVDSPEFAAAFGVQVSVFVREGVQHAELHLNPVETGPVSIAITLEGSQAHVEFGADLAATRQAIENGLPALASALRDAGFTLAGGGVAQHSRSGSGQGGDDPAGHGRSGAARGRRQHGDRRRRRAARDPPRRRRRHRSLRLSRRPAGAPFCAAKAGLIAASPPAPVSIISLKTAPSLPSSAAGADAEENASMPAAVTADTAAAEGGAVPFKRGKKKLLIIVAAALALVLAAGGGSVWVLKKKAAHAAALAAGEDEAAGPEAPRRPRPRPTRRAFRSTCRSIPSSSTWPTRTSTATRRSASPSSSRAPSSPTR